MPNSLAAFLRLPLLLSSALLINSISLSSNDKDSSTGKLIGKSEKLGSDITCDGIISSPPFYNKDGYSDYSNLKEFIELKDIDEVSIGQAIIARSIFVGVEEAVKEILKIINRNV